jgi:very-short-patch-repair endonuclease
MIEPSGAQVDIPTANPRALVPGGGRDRTSRVRAAIAVWKEQLIDLGGRNTLLFYRDQKVGTLDLTGATSESIAALLAGRTVRLASLFGADDQRADAARRLRRLHSKGREHYEERGIDTLYLACGLASWDTASDSTPCAPVLLRPLTLTPRGASQDDFELTLSGEMEVNPTLLQRLRSEFGQEFDQDKLAAQLDGTIDTQWELEATYSWFKQSATVVRNLSIAQRLVVGNFSYAKLPMVRDLEASEAALIAHDFIAAIAGDQDARIKLNAQYDLVTVSLDQPDRTPPADEFLVVDADASQNYAINAVVGGQDLIIQGPPGTGKSQTIANLIATAMARGKTVLFVAEKRAAIDAVFKRLQAVHLDDLLLDIHSAGTNRRQVAETLARSLAMISATPLESHAQEFEDLIAGRTALNRAVHADRVSRPPWGVSASAMRIAAAAVPAEAQTSLRFRGPELDSLNAERTGEIRREIESLAELGAFTPEVLDSPWYRAPLDSPEQASAAFQEAERCSTESLPRVVQAFSSAATSCGWPVPRTLGDCAAAVGAWQAAQFSLEHFRPEVFGASLADLIRNFAPAGGNPALRLISGVFSRSYRSAHAQVRTLALDPRIADATAWRALQAAAQAEAAWRAVGASGTPTPPQQLAYTSSALSDLHTGLAGIEAIVGPLGSETTALDGLSGTFARLVADRSVVLRLPEVRRLSAKVISRGFGPLLTDFAQAHLGPEQCAQRFDYVRARSILDRIEFSDPVVGAFDGAHYTRTIERFRKTDSSHISRTAGRIRRLYAERAVAASDAYKDEAALVRHQAALKKGHLPLRRLFANAPNMLLTLKPCWAMSPLMVSQVLPSERPYFDLVVFDEASQVLPADAIPAIMRGKRVVVAGDDRQLPPTTFFASQALEDEAEIEDLGLELTSTQGFESILQSLSSLLRTRMLTWHYRSRDERLIAFSNVNFYDRALTTFPGVTHDDCIDHVLVPFRSGLSDQERSSTDEVREVVGRIIAHAEHRPTETLGVIALGITHANRIEEALRLELAARGDLNEFFAESREEPFFVKNLERVQGDERDAIILSVGYGKTSDGRLLYRFGPINTEGGERRLNVAVTRAKRRLTVISSFGSADIDLNKTNSRGARLLHDYIRYAESHGGDLGAAALEKPELNPFEIDVKNALAAAGIPAVAQLGASGYRIDFAAQHPHRPGEYVLAIECDGATYHSSPTARDRDRLRQDHLERLGWRFYRIWSSDWVRNRQQSIARLAQAYESAVADAHKPLTDSPRVATGVSSRQEATPYQPVPRQHLATRQRSAARAPVPAKPSGVPRGPRPYVQPNCFIDYYSPAKLIALIDWIESDTLLRTEDELLAEVMKDLGFSRRGSKIVAAITSAIRVARARRVRRGT